MAKDYGGAPGSGGGFVRGVKSGGYRRPKKKSASPKRRARSAADPERSAIRGEGRASRRRTVSADVPF